MRKIITICSYSSLALLALLTGCASTTIFESNFSGVVGQPPPHAQAIGSASVAGDPGSVVVAVLPSLASKWVQIGRANAQTSALAMLQGNFVLSKGAGIYTFSTILYIPSGSSNVATIQFEKFGWPVSDVTGGFLHLDFMQNNQVRIDDNANTLFGNFPRDQAFIVQVTLSITPTATTAHIVLSGAGASGVTNYTIIPALRPAALQFGAVRLWMGFPWTGTFDATQVVVTYKAQ